MKRLIKIGISLLLVIGLGVAGYFLYPILASKQEANTVAFEKFGLIVSPGNDFQRSTGELGAVQLPATFSEENLSPEEKVVSSLIKDINALVEVNTTLKRRVESLELKIADLEDYRAKNIRYAPEQFDLELARVRSELESRLRALPEAQRYSDLMVELMAIAGQQEYIHIVRANDLIMDEARKAIVVQRYLPNYSFCVGNALSVAANSSRELRAVASWLTEPELNPLPADLKADLDIVLPPCQLSFRDALQNVLRAAISR